MTVDVLGILKPIANVIMVVVVVMVMVISRGGFFLPIHVIFITKHQSYQYQIKDLINQTIFDQIMLIVFQYKSVEEIKLFMIIWGSYWAIWRLLCILTFWPLNTWTLPSGASCSCSKSISSLLPKPTSARSPVLPPPCRFCYPKSRSVLSKAQASITLPVALLCSIRNVYGLKRLPGK